MRIAEITAYHVRIGLKRTVRHASHTRGENDTLVVRCRLDNGTEGWGEGLPRPYVTGETIESALEQLRVGRWQELGARFEDLHGGVAVAERVPGATPASSGNGRDCFGNSVRCAVELSILDAASRACGEPLSAVTALVEETAPIRRMQPRVRYSAAITASGPAKQVSRALMFRLFGFRQAKAKVGVEGVDDAAALRRIRRALGEGFDLRIDANEAWSCASLEERLEPLLPCRISALEQPVPHGDVDGLAAIRRRISVPIMLDESLCSFSDGERAIERGTCDLFNIRLSKCGGFLPALRLAGLAHRAGLGYQLGCQVGETGILSAAGRHFATSMGGIRYLEGSFDRYLVKEPLTVENLTFGYGGFAPALRGPGLGVQIDAAAVARVTVREEHWKIR
jgi:muconate cycloisomerase